MSENRMFHVAFVRHGETELNREGLIQGQGVDASLNNSGRAQAKALGIWLRDEEYTFVYSSDLARARQTCEIILSENLLGKSRKAVWEDGIIGDPRIRERCYGIMEGQKREELDKLAKSRNEPRSTFVPEGAESIPDVGDRAESFFLNLCAKCIDHRNDGSGDLDRKDMAGTHGAMNVLVVSHGRLLATLFTRFSEKYGCIFPPGKIGVVPGNTAVTRFDVKVKKSSRMDSAVSDKIDCKMINLKCTSLNNCDHLVNSDIERTAQ